MASGKRGSRNKIITLKLEQQALDLRAQGKTAKEILATLNWSLASRHKKAGHPGGPPTVSKASLDRYYAALDKATVPAVHEPQVAARNAELAINFGEQFQGLNAKLTKWIEEAEDEQLPIMGIGEGGGLVVKGYQPNWHARVAVARELDRNLKLYADLMERIFNAAQIQDFQQTVMEAIEEASPEVAAAIRAKLRERQSVRRAALTGEAIAL